MPAKGARRTIEGKQNKGPTAKKTMLMRKLWVAWKGRQSGSTYMLYSCILGWDNKVLK